MWGQAYRDAAVVKQVEPPELAAPGSSHPPGWQRRNFEPRLVLDWLTAIGVSVFARILRSLFR
jgi:hypothetical protein